MHIEKILLRDVGPFDDVTIEFPKGTDPRLADVYLLTGPNGTGKSTILYALAWLIGGFDSKRGQVELGHDLLSARIRSKTALAALITDDRQVLAATHPTYVPLIDLHARLGGPPDLGSTLVGALVHWHAKYRQRYADDATAFQPDQPPKSRSKFGWAAFAYAGVRTVSDVEVTAIHEPSQSPFEGSLSFVETADTTQLANWIASQNHKRLKAKEAGHIERASQLAQSVRDIEKVIAEIVDDPDFGFVLTDEDENVRVRWKGTVIQLGLLPDGLKSIVSWVADLLMRLDRIPWQDNTPVLERPFLLLLDEVDIHLHPAWQRKVLPLAQQMFPNAQIIASTHSPFVVASVNDARIITLGFQGRSSVVSHVAAPQIGISYTAVLRSIFGIDSEFDIDTERNLNEFHDVKRRLLSGDPAARAEIDRLAELLSNRSEELREIVALELGQLQRQLARRAAP
jgi:predicted ATP-binding protein involved in virulence